MTAKSTPAQIAQRALDASKKKVAKADDEIKGLRVKLAAAESAKKAAEAERDYRALNPALPKPTTPRPTGTGTAQGFADGQGAS